MPKNDIDENSASGSLVKRADELDETEIVDHIHNIATAGLSAIPFVGGSLSSLIDNYIPKRKEERFRKFLRDLAEDVERVKGDLDEQANEHVRTDEFAYLLEKSFRGAVESYHEDKGEAYRAILVNSLLPNAPDEDHKLYFVSLLDAFTPLHIRILRILRDPVAYDEETGKGVGEGGGITTTRLQILRTLMPEYQDELLEGMWRDLNIRGMVSVDSLRGMITDKGILQMRGLLTPLAEQFIGFVTVPE